MKTLESISGSYNDVRVTFLGMPVEPSEKHKATFVDSEFGPFLIDQIFERHLIFATKKGWLQSQQLCRQCRSILDTSHPTRHTFNLDLTFKAFPTFCLTVELPAVTCGSCAASNAILTRALTSDIPDALLNVFQTAGISRS